MEMAMVEDREGSHIDLRVIKIQSLTEMSMTSSARWMTLSGCLYVAGSCGMSTTFGLFSPSLEDILLLPPR
jgi:hypothetical protein